MAYRFYLEVFDNNGQKVYDEQLLGNNECLIEGCDLRVRRWVRDGV